MVGTFFFVLFVHPLFVPFVVQKGGVRVEGSGTRSKDQLLVESFTGYRILLHRAPCIFVVPSKMSNVKG